ncbi:MAG: hypothetical protein QY329_12695 [Anaerolineales bacterium]|nr:MAG: hypothetical protein QY329_12695 [Anaerolineales bacterium]
MNDLISILSGVILLSPAWIWVVSRKSWQVSTKKIVIVTLAILSAAISVYGFLRPHVNFSPVWIGQFVLVLFFIAVAASVYFYWPREDR